MRILLAAAVIAVGTSAHAETPSGCIGNRVWFDENGDGVQQHEEPGVAGVRLSLVDGSGEVLDRDETQSRGYFELCSAPGAATLQVEIPAGHAATAQGAGRSIHKDSNIDSLGLAAVEVIDGREITNVDIGLVATATDDSNDEDDDRDEGGTGTDDEAQDGESGSDDGSGSGGEEGSSDGSGSGDGGGSNDDGGSGDDGSSGDTGGDRPRGSDEFRYGVWIEARNAMPQTADQGVTAAFPMFDFAHVRGKSFVEAGRDRDNPEYVANILDAARRTDTALDLQLGSSQAYGWNYSTQRGNFSVRRWKSAVSAFAEDAVADAAIRRALADGTIRYIFLMDEPNHSRWSPGWDGRSSSSGDVNHVTNADLDEMAAHVKALWGGDVQTIVRASPVRLIQSRRGGMYRFRHVTHAYISPGPSKWLPGDPAPGKGFEWWLTQKDNHTNDLTNCTAFRATGLEMAVMLQWGFESRGNPYDGDNDWKNGWWGGDVRYPYRGRRSYVKAAPLEMDFIAKHFMVPRDPVTCEIDEANGERLVDTIVSFRWDRLPTDRNAMPMSSYPHYRQFHEQLRADIATGNTVPRIGLPVGIGAQ